MVRRFRAGLSGGRIARAGTSPSLGARPRRPARPDYYHS